MDKYDVRKFWLLKWVLVLALAAPMLAQQCTKKETLTTATSGQVFSNNTAQPNCNAFALTWVTTGFSAISIQLEGSNNGGTWAAFSGASTVVVGTNPATTLSGTIKVAASDKIAYLRVNLTSKTGTGSLAYQLYGYSGTTAGLGELVRECVCKGVVWVGELVSACAKELCGWVGE